MLKRLSLALALLAPLPALAVEPSEMLDDPALEERARVISKELRCLVCRNENIDDSNASLAKDLRLLVRERLVDQHLKGLKAEINRRELDANPGELQGLRRIADAVDETLAAPSSEYEAIWEQKQAELSDLKALLEQLAEAVHVQQADPESNESVVSYVVDRYGEYVLLKPTLTGSNLVLYIAGPAMLLLGLGVAFGYIRSRRKTEAAPQALSPEEEARLKEIMGE